MTHEPSGCRDSTSISWRKASRVQRCAVCNANVDEGRKIVPEAATEFVQFCGLTCYEAWRRSRPLADRLAARGGDLSVGE